MLQVQSHTFWAQKGLVALVTLPEAKMQQPDEGFWKLVLMILVADGRQRRAAELRRGVRSRAVWWSTMQLWRRRWCRFFIELVCQLHARYTECVVVVWARSATHWRCKQAHFHFLK